MVDVPGKAGLPLRHVTAPNILPTVMDMDRAAFLRHLQRSQLLSDEALQQVSISYPKTKARDLARELVLQGMLTPYQAKQILRGRTKRLVLGLYHILEEIGRGSTGRVFKAIHTTMGRIVAIKTLVTKTLTNSQDLKFFQREVLAAAQLHHPNIVAAYDAGESKGVHFLVMEFVDGPSLLHLMRQQGQLATRLASELMRQAAEALQYSHEKGIVHRDIKPGNLLVAHVPDAHQGVQCEAARPVLKILDFGLARLQGSLSTARIDTLSVKTGAVLGTLDYISPEQAEDVHSVDIRSDLYSLGCTFYHALAGKPPFPSHNPLEKLLKHLREEPVRLDTLRPDLPPGLCDIIHRLMAKDKAQRFQLPRELSEALAPFCTFAHHIEPSTTAPAIASEAEKASAIADEPLSSASPSTIISSSSLPGIQQPVDDSFREQWEQWTLLVERSLQQRGNRHWIDPVAFRGQREELLVSCRTRARITQGQQREFFQQLEELVKPWVNSLTLVQMDFDIHYSLVEACRRVHWAMANCQTETREPKGVMASLSQLFAQLKGCRTR